MWILISVCIIWGGRNAMRSKVQVNDAKIYLGVKQNKDYPIV